MKKPLCLVLTFCMLLSLAAIPTVAGAETTEIIIDDLTNDSSIATTSRTGTWTRDTTRAYYGGSALKSPNSAATFTVYPKVSEGLYDVWIYGAWSGWGTMSWTITNGFSDTRGIRVSTSGQQNDGAQNRWRLSGNVDGWYKMSTVYFSGVHGTDAITFTRTANQPCFDAIKLVASEYDASNFVLTDDPDADNAAPFGTVTASGTRAIKWDTAAHNGGITYFSDYSGTGSATFKPWVPAAGWYKISVYNQCKRDSSGADAWNSYGTSTWTIDNGLGLSDRRSAQTGRINVSQDLNYLNDGWYTLSTVYLSGTDADTVTFSKPANTRIVVDAIKVEAATPDSFNSFIMDEAEYAYGGDKQFGSFERVGTWNLTASEAAYNGKYYSTAEYNDEVITFSPIVEDGYYNIYMFKNHADAAGTMQWTASDGTDSVNGLIDQQTAVPADGWLKLGTVHFSGSGDSIVLTPTSGVNMVDAIKIERAAAYLDIVQSDGQALSDGFGSATTPYASAVLYKGDAGSENLYLFLAEYDGSGNVTGVNCRIVDTSGIAQYGEGTYRIPLTLAGSSGIVRAFLWNSVLAPLSEVKERSFQ